MEPDRFDNAVRALFGASSRRALNRVFAGFAAGILLASPIGIPGVAARKRKRGKKKKKKSPPPPQTRCNTIAGFLSCIEQTFGLEDCCNVFEDQVCTPCGCCQASDVCCGTTCCPAGRQCCGETCCQEGYKCCGNTCCLLDRQCCDGGGCCHTEDVCCRTTDGDQYCCSGEEGLQCKQTGGFTCQ